MSREISVEMDEVLAASLVEEAAALLESGVEAEIPVYSDIIDSSAVLPERYDPARQRRIAVGEAVDKILNIDEERQAEYVTGSNNPRQLSYHWMIAASRRHPGLYAVSEAALKGGMGGMVARRESILVSPTLDLTNTNSTNFNHFFECVIKGNI